MVWGGGDGGVVTHPFLAPTNWRLVDAWNLNHVDSDMNIPPVQKPANVCQLKNMFDQKWQLAPATQERLRISD